MKAMATSLGTFSQNTKAGNFDDLDAACECEIREESGSTQSSSSGGSDSSHHRRCWNSEVFEEHAAQLRPPVTEDELKFRARIPIPAREAWDMTRLALDHYFPCLSSYLPLELDQERFFLLPTDLVIILIAIVFLPMYILYFDSSFEVITAFVFFRVMLTGGLALVRLYKPWRGNAVGLLFADVVVFLNLYGGLYNEIGIIIKMSGYKFNDTRLQRIEQHIFGTQPSTELSRVTDSRVLGEYLHFCYFAFYGIMIVPVLVVWWRYPRQSFLHIATAQLLAMFLCAVAWINYPTAGPYWTLGGRPAGEVGFVMPYVVQFLNERGSSMGTACPSSHCALATGIWLAMVWETGHYNMLFLLSVPGLWLSTIYGAFHYVVDSLIGILVGIVSAALGRMLVHLWLTKFSLSISEISGNTACEDVQGGADGVTPVPEALGHEDV